MVGAPGRVVARSQQQLLAGADTALWAVLASSLLFVLILQATRVFVSDLVFVVDQSRRTLLLVIIAITFASPLIAPLFDVQRSTSALVSLAGSLVVARFLLQFVQWPIGRLVLSGLVLVSASLSLVPLLRYRARAGLGLVLGAGIDVSIRTVRETLDLPWLPGLGSHLTTVLLVTLSVIATTIVVLDRGPLEPRGSFGFAGIGPATGLLHLVVGNLGFAVVHTDWSLPFASALLGIGLLTGLTLVPVLTRHWLGWVGTVLAGGIGLWLAWGSSWSAALGLMLTSSAWTIATVVVGIGGRLSRRAEALGQPALAFATGQLLMVATLFRYYTATGDRWIPLVLWSVLVFIAAIEWPSGWPAGTLALFPAVALGIVVPLAGAIVWQVLRPEPPRATARLPGEFTVMTYNIQSGYGRDQRWNLEATARAIEASGADVVLLQEVSRGWLVTSSADQLGWLARRLGMEAIWGPASADGLWGNAVLTKTTPLATRRVQFTRTQNLRRGAVAIQLATERGSVWATSTHLDDPRGAVQVRLTQIEELLAFTAPLRPLILGGDFNADPGSIEMRRLQEAGFLDAAAAIGALAPTSRDSRRIDYILVTEDLLPQAGAIPDVAASDHRPVVVRLTVRE